MAMTGVRGPTLILILAASIAVVAVVGFLTLRKAQHLRFATSIHAVPESPYHDLLPLGQPIKVRIDLASAGHSPLKALALLLDGDGNQLAELRPLRILPLPSGKLTEEADFPPLTALPAQRLLAAAVIRLPTDAPEARARIAAAIVAGQQRHKQLPAVFSNILAAAKELGGHAELTQVEVRPHL
jgi:hypothetical protein